MFIYKIHCVYNNYSYIGASINPNIRFKSHITSLKNGTHQNKKLRNDFDFFGINDFVLKIIEECDPKIAKERENFWIKNTIKTYNQRVSDYSFKKIGKNHSEETKQKIRNSCIGKRGRVLTSQESERIRSFRKVEKPIINLNTLQIFKSLASCAKFYHVTQPSIYGSIQRNGTCKGYKFDYLINHLNP